MDIDELASRINNIRHLPANSFDLVQTMDIAEPGRYYILKSPPPMKQADKYLCKRPKMTYCPID